MGAGILDFAKYYMLENILRKNFSCNPLHSDTDSFVYEVYDVSFHETVAGRRDLTDRFDFLNFDPEYSLYSQTNNKVTLKMKDEMDGDKIGELVGLKPKL